MINRTGAWRKLGVLLKPDPGREWMATYTGPSFACPRPDQGLVELYVTGRDSRNRSRIGVVTFNPQQLPAPLTIGDGPVFDIGELGAFDENGVSYPWIVEDGARQLMYYVGWMPTVLTPFQNHLGLAERTNGGGWSRVSKAPILPRTNEEYLSLGSAAVLRRGDRWLMWYTSFRQWAQTPNDPKHIYVIKFAESSDGICWRRPNRVCVDARLPNEFAVSRPSVLYHDGLYHMWFSYRGEHYRIGYAWSEDGIEWSRRDDLAGIDVSASGWDGLGISYSHVFRWKHDLYMIYCGNHYGRDGLGVAVRPA
jgi:transposase